MDIEPATVFATKFLEFPGRAGLVKMSRVVEQHNIFCKN